jgi:hypothetical protein
MEKILRIQVGTRAVAGMRGRPNLEFSANHKMID